MSELYTTANWNALGSSCTLVIYEPNQSTNHNLADLAETVTAITEEFEHRFSRFLSTSELTGFNTHAPGRFQVSDELYQLLATAKQMHQRTAGFFDPTVISYLKRYGYVKANTHWPLTVDTPKHVPLSPPFSKLVLEDKQSVIKPPGLEVDLGGIAKTFLLRQIRETVLHGVTNYYLSLGGDVITKGVDGKHAGWLVEIDPVSAQPKTQLETVISGLGSICTSGIVRRKGVTGHQAWHHIIDPSTHASLHTPVLAATAQGDDPVWTEQVARLALKEYEIIDSTWLHDHDCQKLWLQFATTVTHLTV